MVLLILQHHQASILKGCNTCGCGCKLGLCGAEWLVRTCAADCQEQRCTHCINPMGSRPTLESVQWVQHGVADVDFLEPPVHQFLRVRDTTDVIETLLM